MKYDAYEVGLRAYNVRLSLSKKQSDVSESIGISQAKYSRFEGGKCDLPLSDAVKLCEYLGISISWLTGEKSIPRLTDSERLDVEKYINYVISLRGKS
jgi:transcriptional regulator with XRE-family HTH domain